MLADARFIALEGPKAAGKTTLVTALAARLGACVGAPVLTKEPTPAFDVSQEQRLQGVALAAAIAEDRRRHLTEVIAPALARGRTVICDRYLLSSYVFHTADGVQQSVVEQLNRGCPLPCVNVVLCVQAAELGRRRAGRARATRLQRQDPAAETAAYLHYAEVMQTQGVARVIVDNSTMTDHYRLLDWLCESHLEGLQ
ncbi:AAA family ATPase [Actinomadura graeca]|uniref:Thymidylate kinase n=1 Tax=Actinomadura graeca TaxID=2750812 RepID=A0ABX8R4M2_9ACTN|nr:AAA family ATPase [Actinomadura graeca]QXJ25783.1 AAA family ATPase [Actinomadura graeca]